jgi:hypothetical protein
VTDRDPFWPDIQELKMNRPPLPPFAAEPSARETKDEVKVDLPVIADNT